MIVAGYGNDQGEMDGIGDWPLCSFLSRPEHFVRREDTVKVTPAASGASVDLFRQQAQRQRVPYQRMIRALVNECAKWHGSRLLRVAHGVFALLEKPIPGERTIVSPCDV